MKRLASLILSMVALAIPLFAQHYQSYEFPNLGQGNAINSSGQVAAVVPQGNYEAYLWTRTGGFRDLGSLGNSGSYAWAISDSGEVTGFSAVGQNPYAYAAFLWTPGGRMQNLGAPLGGTSGGYAVNNAGQVAGQSCTPKQDLCEAFFWSAATGGINIGALNGDTQSFPYSMNNNGEIVGVSDQSLGSPYFGFEWTLNTGIQQLPNFGGQTIPFSINDSGQIVGYSTYPDGTERAVLWSPDGSIQDLGTLPGDTDGWAWHINAAGHVVGFSYHLSGKQRVGQNFFWTAKAGMTAIGAPYLQFVPAGFNNRDQILLQSQGGCYLWSPSLALQRVTGCNRDGQSGFNDAGVLLTERGNGFKGVYFAVAFPIMRVSLTSSQNPSHSGQTVIFTATVSSIVGPPPDREQVNFFDGKKTMGSGTLTNGVASFATSALKLGKNNIHAEYVGDGNYYPNKSARLVQVVNP